MSDETVFTSPFSALRIWLKSDGTFPNNDSSPLLIYKRASSLVRTPPTRGEASACSSRMAGRALGRGECLTTTTTTPPRGRRCCACRVRPISNSAGPPAQRCTRT